MLEFVSRIFSRFGWPPRSIRTKVAMLTLVVVLVPLLGTTMFGQWLTSRYLQERALLRASDALARQAREVEAFLDSARQDVYYLAQLYSLRRLLQARAQNQTVDAVYWQRQLAEDFRIFAATHPTYYQIRFLDARGQEQVRVNQPLGSEPYIVPEALLQNKAHRYYFQEAARLKPGEMYISSLDLNREYGAIERPLHPVLRYATPLYWEGQLAGVVVANLHAQRLLDILYENDVRRRMAGDTILVDQEGYYLFHPDPRKQWGSPHDLDTGENLYRDAPEIAAEVLSGRSGAVEYGAEVWVYLPIHPAPRENSAYYWVLIQREPRAQLFAEVADFRMLAGGVLAIALLVSAFMSWAVARVITQPVVRLAAAVERLGQGDLSVRVSEEVDSELGHLMAAFNRMAESIRRDVEHLQLLHQGTLALTQQLDLCQALRTAAQTLARLLHAPWVAVYRIDGQGMWHDTTAHHGPAPRVGSPRQGPPWPQAQPVQRIPAVVGQGIWWAVYLHWRRTQGYVLCLPFDPARDDARVRGWMTVLAHQAETVLKNIYLYVSLQQHREQLSDLLSRVIRTQEEERKWVAYDLHDGLIQLLVGVRLHLNNYLLLRDRAPDEAQAALEQAVQELQQAIREGRRLIQGLRPTVLDDLGLAVAVREMAERMAQEHGWQLILELEVPRRLSFAVETTAYRIVQEALSNVRKHAQARQVLVRLWVEGERLFGLVRDDGHGFDPEALEQMPPAARHARPGIGLRSMRERARLLGGVWRIESRPGQGTSVRFWLPLPTGDEDHDPTHSRHRGR